MHLVTTRLIKLYNFANKKTELYNIFIQRKKVN